MVGTKGGGLASYIRVVGGDSIYQVISVAQAVGDGSRRSSEG